MTRRMRRLLTPLLFPVTLLAAAGTASAQQPDSVLVPGERIRVHWDAGRAAGTLVERSGNLLVIRPDRGDELRRVSLAGVTRLEVWGCCTKRGGFATGGFIGAGAVLLGGAMLTLMVSSDTGANLAMAGAALMAPVGFVVGALVGNDMSEEGEGWIEVPVPAPAPPDGG